MQSSPTDDDLQALYRDLQAAERAIASAVRRAGTLASSGVAERVEAGSLDWAISMACRWTGADARTIVGAGEMLQHLPTVADHFARGLVSWGQVRRITFAARKLSIEQRAELDARFAAAADRYDGVDAYDPDHLCDAVDAAAEEVRGATALERSERAAARDGFLSIQGRTDGGSTGYWSADAVTSAVITNALQAARPVPAATADRKSGAPTNQGRQQLEALAEVCSDYLLADTTDEDSTGQPDAAGEPDNGDGGRDDDGRPAGGEGATRHPDLRRRGRRRRGRYLINLHFDLSQVSISPTGVLELNVPGPLPRISAAALEILARDADFAAVLFDGKRPLATAAKLYGKDVPADVRFAVRARDSADRWPGSRQPVTRTEPHHIVERARDGTHDPDNLACLTRRPHTNVHDNGWRLRLNNRTGELRVTRRGRTWRSLPRSTGLPPARDAGDLAEQPTGENPPPQLPF
jgi:hypothetical protein